MAQNDGVYVFPDAMTKASGIDPGLLALLNQNGGFGNSGNWIWILFLWLIWGGNGNWGNGMGLSGVTMVGEVMVLVATTELVILLIRFLTLKVVTCCFRLLMVELMLLLSLHRLPILL